MNIKTVFALVGIGALSARSGNLGTAFDVPLAYLKSEDVGIWTSPEGC